MEEEEMLSEEELGEIHRYTRRKMAKEELYTFPLVLCDNGIDRDFQRFTKETLQELQPLFVGKTGIFDHNPTAKGQTARIYRTYLEEEPEKQVAEGECYVKLCAKAYLPRSEKNKELILELDSGMKKEVSVGCSVAKRVCSLCGKEVTKTPCQHTPGTVVEQNGKRHVVHERLEHATDAYEWSFVAVPAQVGAGVTKQYRERENNCVSGEKVENNRRELAEVGKRETKNENNCVSGEEDIHSMRELAEVGKRGKEKANDTVSGEQDVNSMREMAEIGMREGKNENNCVSGEEDVNSMRELAEVGKRGREKANDTVSGEEAENNLRELAEVGKRYREGLKKQARRLFGLEGSVPREVSNSMVESLTVEELEQLCAGLKKQVQKQLPVGIQLQPRREAVGKNQVYQVEGGTSYEL